MLNKTNELLQEKFVEDRPPPQIPKSTVTKINLSCNKKHKITKKENKSSGKVSSKKEKKLQEKGTLILSPGN